MPPTQQDIFPESGETLSVLSQHRGTVRSLLEQNPTLQLARLWVLLQTPNSHQVQVHTCQVHLTFCAHQGTTCGRIGNG